MSLKLVIHPPVEPQRLARIVAAAGAMHVVNAEDPQAARQAIVDADAFFGKLTPELLSAARRLRWVQSPTASMEHYLFPALVEHPAQLTNMRGLYGDVIAEHVLGILLAFTRNLHTYIRQQALARWEPVGGEAERASFAAGPGVTNAIDRAHRSLGDLTLGIVGLGGIGSELAVRASGLGMRVVAVDPVEQPRPPLLSALWPPRDLDQLLATSDFVVIAAPHTPSTEQLFRRPQFETMQRSAVLVNVGRGAIVDLDDLVWALESKKIAGAALDVAAQEPLPSDHPLWRMPGVIITPHVAGQSPRVAPRHLAVLLDNLKRFVAGEPLANVVDKRAWY
ncbi:MAG TPA: D-2-hydroxyacid dehydrogenase [Pirellulales bacterium]|jgi:phosphoglycerate dehydrogenase-like enzyme|nr:D-2-hydroxyacid dehydrogenase [Pirellulales bacterium]